MVSQESKSIKGEIEDEYTPKLFSEEHNIENSKENDFSENQNKVTCTIQITCEIKI